MNNTVSVIHARWTHPSGRSYAIVVRDQRAQHQSRRLALASLVTLVAAYEAEAQTARKGGYAPPAPSTP